MHAVEGDAARHLRHSTGLSSCRRAEARHHRTARSLSPSVGFKELDAFDGLVFDPPRAGAEDQSKQIARSDIPLVAAVSCNPATLARDLAILSTAAIGWRA